MQVDTNTNYNENYWKCLKHFFVNSRECETKYTGADCWKKSFSFFIEDFVFNIDKYLSLVEEINNNEVSLFQYNLP